MASPETTEAPAPFTIAISPWRRAFQIALALLVLTIIADHAGLFGYRGNDWAAFDGKRVLVKEVVDGQTIVVAHSSAKTTTKVHLLGVAAPGGSPATTQAADAARAYLEARLRGKEVLLTLPPTVTRDAESALLAYVYLSTESINQSIIATGLAFADRRGKHPLRGAFEDAENDPRIKKRGMWSDLRFDDQPQWRREWLSSKSKATKPER